MATIGRASAVADFGWLQLRGWIGWLAWLFVHILNLIGFRNRLVVLVQWAWAYFTYQRSVRLITGNDPDSRAPRRDVARGPRARRRRRARARADRPCPRSSAWYSTGLYLRLQAVLTPLTNRVPFALLDLAVGCLPDHRRHRVRASCRGDSDGDGRCVSAVRCHSWSSAAAVLYLLFLAMWGLNYRRVPLERKLDYDRARHHARLPPWRWRTGPSTAMNGGYAAAHTPSWTRAALEARSQRVVRRLGATELRRAWRSEAVAADATTSAARRSTG